MPTAPIDDQGNVLFYEDTGAPQNSSNEPYTTMIIVHGTAFHSGQFLAISSLDVDKGVQIIVVFHPIIPFATRYNLRFILINRRDYPGSSPYSDEDLHNVGDTEDDKGYEAFFKARAFEFARFIEWIVEHEDIPKADWNGNAGGIFLMAWSAGNGYAVSTLSYVDLLTETTRSNIQPYLRGFIFFDAPRWIHGFPQPTGGTIDQIFRDESITAEQRARIFSKWVGGFYKHPTLTSHDVADLQKEPDPGSRRSTTEAMTSEELEKCTDYNAVLRSEMKARIGPMAGYVERIRRAVFDDRLAEYWPGCRIHVIWCENSPWPMAETAWTFERLKEACVKEGTKGRRLTVEMMPAANHFPHWEEPEKFVAFFAKAMAS
ncbi:hypothetical protein SCHPADRAFT_890146 [Schizopora paradoxa]|uniref:AB hydrolase-1 domain-containing protein n=1 Tax=Schizopora paradoxa TaxID=27342 RepID=A0A0H2RNS3_9AGAM|nr:hypothetical protein SCHPADRAFT_890146 [Schizopora paradoxa]